MRNSIDVLVDNEQLKDKHFDYRMYMWLLLQADDNNQLNILSFKKTEIKNQTGIKHSTTIDNLLDYILYVPHYKLFEQISGNLKMVNVIPHYEIEGIFSLYLNQDIVKMLLSYREENTDKLIRTFLFLWKKSGSYKGKPYKPTIKEILAAIGLQTTQKNRESLYKCLDWLKNKGFITCIEDYYPNTKNNMPVPCLNIKWTWSNKKGFFNIIEEEKEECLVQEIKEEVQEEIKEQKIIEDKQDTTIVDDNIEEWKVELAEKLLGRTISKEEYDKLEKQNTLDTKEHWERNKGDLGTQKEYEEAMLNRVKQVLNIKDVKVAEDDDDFVF